MTNNDEIKDNIKNNEPKPGYYKTIAGRQKKKPINITVDLSKLTIAELMELSPTDIEDDFIVPVELAAKLKGISVQAIYRAIGDGKLKRINGILLSSLNSYKVDKIRKMNGKQAVKDIK